MEDFHELFQADGKLAFADQMELELAHFLYYDIRYIEEYNKLFSVHSTRPNTKPISKKPNNIPILAQLLPRIILKLYTITP